MEVTVNLSRAPNVQISPACSCLRPRSSHGPLMPAPFSSNHPDRRPLTPAAGLSSQTAVTAVSSAIDSHHGFQQQWQQ